ncbi:MAG: tRNA 2-thiouridine(34) synthase MnmA [Actinobacteria bacterium]|jgi:tRNA-specific 2-thiouridylase|nr:tRNA 2-thiouridine(34) synthase MnmA [Actinomycetota bacterium]
MRVLVAMSGGVDSSVAAARMVDAGHEVVGVHLALSRSHSVTGGRSKGCCTLDDARDARRVADMLGIAYYVWDLSERFTAEVIDDFIDEYQQGRTPNPCLRCNERIKFSAVLDRALALDFDVVATGHYARLVAGPQGTELHRAVDPTKDQSYVLGVLSADQLAHAAFPLGGDLKDEVRAEAEQRGLLTARKPDSHDICFIPDGDTAAYLHRRLGSLPGDVVDAESGDVVARHDGTFAFTIGQRRGLNLRMPAEDGAPRYVVDVDVESRTVTVGPPALLDVDSIEGIRPIWSGPALGAVPVPVEAQVRAHGEPVPGTARVVDERLVVDLTEPVRGLAAGQAVVIYQGTRVLGSATVDRTHRVVTA